MLALSFEWLGALQHHALSKRSSSTYFPLVPASQASPAPPCIDSTRTWAEQSKSTTPLPGQSFMADTNFRLSRELVHLPGHPPTATTTALALGSDLCCCRHHCKLLRYLPCTARVLCPAVLSSDSAGACVVFFDQFPYVSSSAGSPSSLPCARAVTVAPSVPTLHASTVDHHHCS